MSRQLSLAAAASVFAMTAFVLYATSGADSRSLAMQTGTGAPMVIEAPAQLLQVPEMPTLQFLAD